MFVRSASGHLLKSSNSQIIDILLMVFAKVVQQILPPIHKLHFGLIKKYNKHKIPRVHEKYT